MATGAELATIAAASQQRLRAATIQVGGMTCGACSSTVERALANVSGVQEATVSCVTGLARVKFDADVVQADQLLDTVDCVGFDAKMETEEDVSAPAPNGAAPRDATISVEIRVSGMTCSACSGTVEKLLQGLPGVSRATVSLILSRAYVVCSASKQSPEALCEEIECVGFDAEVICTGAADMLSGQATLHVQATCPSGTVEALARQLGGVIGCRTLSEGQQRIAYDPHVTGGRQLLARLKEAVGPGAEVEWTGASSSDEQLQGHTQHIWDLQRDLCRAGPPAAVTFFLVMVLPSLGTEHALADLLETELHPGLTILTVLVLSLATPVQFIPGRRFHSAAFAALKRRSPNMDVLVSVASSTAYFYSLGLVIFCLTMPELPSVHILGHATGHFLAMGPVLIAVVLLGKSIESRAKLKAMEALTDIPSNLPATAIICEDSGETVQPVELVELGDVLRIYAGGRIPVDGTMCSGSAVHVDESMLTGESRPVSKQDGDQLFGGTLCLSGGCLMRVTKVGGDTTLGQMVKLVQDAQASKAGVQRVADSVARVFVPFVVGLSIFTFAVWSALVFMGKVEPPMLHSMDPAHHGMERDPRAVCSLKLLFAMKFGIAVLMIACPCAMGLATPMAVMVSTGLAAKRGCLVKSAEALEVSARLDVVVLDKTGTITKGEPRVSAAACCAEAFAPLEQAWEALRASADETPRRRNALDTDDASPGPSVHLIGGKDGPSSKAMQDCFWWILGSLESASDHPIARCVLSAAQEIPGLPPIAAPHDFEVTAGRGVRCTLSQLGGVTARVGNLTYFMETMSGQTTQANQALLDWMGGMQQQGHIVVLLHVEGRPFGAVALQDPVREEAAWVVGYMEKTLGAEVWLCTGDNAATAQCIADQVGITHVIAEALPSTKSECVAKLQRPEKAGDRPRRVCFVGDGMNDSPALAQADVGVALGVGAHVAVEAADVALVRSELSDCVTFLALSKATFRTILLNFFWAFCFNFLCLPVAAGLFYPAVYIPPLVAGMGMACSSLFVVCSSLMLRRFSPPVPRIKRLKRPTESPGGSADELVDGAKRPISLKAQMIGSGKSCKYQKFRC
jgi:Cu+-exporting ATPase